MLSSSSVAPLFPCSPVTWITATFQCSWRVVPFATNGSTDSGEKLRCRSLSISLPPTPFLQVKVAAARPFIRPAATRRYALLLSSFLPLYGHIYSCNGDCGPARRKSSFPPFERLLRTVLFVVRGLEGICGDAEAPVPCYTSTYCRGLHWWQCDWPYHSHNSYSPPTVAPTAATPRAKKRRDLNSCHKRCVLDDVDPVLSDAMELRVPFSRGLLLGAGLFANTTNPPLPLTTLVRSQYFFFRSYTISTNTCASKYRLWKIFSFSTTTNDFPVNGGTGLGPLRPAKALPCFFTA